MEGPRALGAALDHGAHLSFALRTAGLNPSGQGGIEARLEAAGVELLTVDPGTFAELGDTDTPQGILGLALEPEAHLPFGPEADPQRPDAPAAEARILILDRIQDPGNAGALIRVAAALGADGVVVLDGTVDPWNPKAVRASAGLVFRLPPVRLPWDRARGWLERAGLPLLVAHPAGSDVRAWLSRERGASGVDRGWALLLGNEGAGPRPEARREAHAELAVPLPPGVDSLNVATAGAILLWALGSGR